MRTNEEMRRAVRDRAAQMRRARRTRWAVGLGGTAAACAAALIAGMAAAMPAFRDRMVSGDGVGRMQASVLAGSGALGYAVVGIAAFLLGVAVTLFCVLLRKWRDEEDHRP